MTLPPDSLPATDTDEPALSPLIPQPSRPNLPIRVPVAADFGSGNVVIAEVIGSTPSVLLLQGPDTGSKIAPLGALVRLRVEWDHQALSGRLAAHGVAGRFLVSIGQRGIRRSRRFAVDLPGIARSPQLAGLVEVRVVDLSTGGARVEGIELPVGSELELRFTPPGQPAPITALGFVVRMIEIDDVRSVGLAFRLVQPSMDLLGSTVGSAKLGL
jgi:hypothetical protein